MRKRCRWTAAKIERLESLSVLHIAEARSPEDLMVSLRMNGIDASAGAVSAKLGGTRDSRKGSTIQRVSDMLGVSHSDARKVVHRYGKALIRVHRTEELEKVF